MTPKEAFHKFTFRGKVKSSKKMAAKTKKTKRKVSLKRKRLGSTKKQKKVSAKNTDLSDIKLSLRHLSEGPAYETSTSEESVWHARLRRLLGKINKKGRKRITVMLIPHTEKKILSWHANVYTIFALLLALILFMSLSVVSLIDKSGEDIQFYDMGLGNREFAVQAMHISEEIIPLHKLIHTYTSTIAEIYLSLDGKKSEVQNLSIESRSTLETEITELQSLVENCRFQKEECSQQNVEEILRKTIHLSSQDNHSIKKAIALAKDIIDILNTKEKRKLFRHTPSIWPTQGHLLSPYGLQFDPLRGRQVFKRGIEIGALPGTPVLSTAPGEIAGLSYNDDYGLNIYIRHNYGIATFYAHLDRARVKIGEKVDKGEVIGYVGQTGSTSLPMLYYEVHVGTVAYNPYAFINHLQESWLLLPKI